MISILLTAAAILVLIAGTLLSIVFGAPGGEYSLWYTLLYFSITIVTVALLLGGGEIISLLKELRDRRE